MPQVANAQLANIPLSDIDTVYDQGWDQLNEGLDQLSNFLDEQNTEANENTDNGLTLPEIPFPIRIGRFNTETLTEDQVTELAALREQRRAYKQSVINWRSEIASRLARFDLSVIRDIEGDLTRFTHQTNTINERIRLFRQAVLEGDNAGQMGHGANPDADSDDQSEPNTDDTDNVDTADVELVEQDDAEVSTLEDNEAEPDFVFVDDGQDDFDAGLNSGGCTLSSTAPTGASGSVLGFLICGALAILLKKRISA